MKLKLSILLVGLFFLNPQVLSCDCKGSFDLKKEQIKNLERSDIVFVGKVKSVEVDSSLAREGWFQKERFTFKILELLKGDYTNSLIHGLALSSCDLVPIEGSTWIVYASFEYSENMTIDSYTHTPKENKVFISLSNCSISRSFNEPERLSVNGYRSIPPTREEYSSWNHNDDLSREVEIANIKLKALDDLKKELDWLRSSKQNK